MDYEPFRLLCPWGFLGKQSWSGFPFASPGIIEYYLAIKNNKPLDMQIATQKSMLSDKVNVIGKVHMV